jgi:SNW domain-containing protein 1
MSTLAAALAQSLPKPKYTGEDEKRTEQRGPRIVGPGQLDETQITVRRAGPPPYGQRAGWRPRTAADFGDGGAFPEVPIAQYPLEMGKASSSNNNQIAVQVDAEGKVDYTALARQGHTADRVIHASFKDLIPLRNRANAGEISLARPSEEEVAATTEKTKNALAALVSGAVAAQKPKNLNVGQRKEATFVKYTPSNQGYNNKKGGDRIIKIMERQRDPMEPPKFKHKKIPRGPPSPPPPVMHSPPRKLTAEDQEAWKIPRKSRVTPMYDNSLTSRSSRK